MTLTKCLFSMVLIFLTNYNITDKINQADYINTQNSWYYDGT